MGPAPSKREHGSKSAIITVVIYFINDKKSLAAVDSITLGRISSVMELYPPSQAFFTGNPGFVGTFPLDNILNARVHFFRRVTSDHRRETIAKLFLYPDTLVKAFLSFDFVHPSAYFQDGIHRLWLDVNHNGEKVVGA